MTGMTTAIVSMNAVVNHCAATAVMLRSRMRWGIATFIVVSLRIATNAATRSSQITRFCSAVTPVSEIGGAVGVPVVAAMARSTPGEGVVASRKATNVRSNAGDRVAIPGTEEEERMPVANAESIGGR